MPGGCLWLTSPREGTDRENTPHFDWEWPRSLRFQGVGFSLPGSPVLVELCPPKSMSFWEPQTVPLFGDRIFAGAIG